MRKYLLYFSFVVAPFVIFCIAFSGWAQMTYGDLSRIGNWTERDFAPTLSQPVIRINANGTSILDPDIEVLGDSFTIENRWQSIVSDKTGFKIKSFQYNQNCIERWVQSVASDSTAKVVIIESVERTVIGKFVNLGVCENKEPVPLSIQAQSKDMPKPFFPTTVSLSYLLTSAKNKWKLHRRPGETFSDNGVISTPIRQDCALFSNRQNNRILYYAEDDLKEKWSEEDIAHSINNLIKIRDTLQQHGKKFILIVAPDKSSTYLDCITADRGVKHSPDIARVIRSAGIEVPDLKTVLARRKNSVVDLYEPNDTHWSPRGYIVVGNELSKYLSQQIAL